MEVIRPIPGRRDWFFAPRELVQPIFGAAGIGVEATRCRIHRTHLPLIDHQDAQRHLLVVNNDPAEWAQRDIETAKLGFKLRTTQQQGIDFIAPRRGTLIGDDMRVGKGHPVGTGVLTPDGYRAVETLRVGDAVIGSDGFVTTITGTYRRGCLPVFRVKFSDGASVRVDGDHLWTAWDHNAWARKQAPATKATRDLIDDLEYTNGNRKWRIPMVKPIQFATKELRLDPYLLGVLLGDGSFTSPGVVFTPGDEDVPREVSKVLPSGVELRTTLNAERATTWRVVDAEREGNRVLDELRTLALIGRKSGDKFVPWPYMFGSVHQRLALLQGLMDTDGELSRNGTLVGFSSASEVLAQAVAFLVESLGGNARRHLKLEPRYMYQGEERIGLPSHRLTLSLPPGINPFRARQGYRGHDKFKPSRTISSIEPAGEDEVICISVDAKDQLYVTEHCIVTHNTLTALMSHDKARGALVVVAPLQARGVWLGWIKRVFPGEEIGVALGRKFDPSVLTKPIIFLHYDVLKDWQALFKIGTIIFDEAHFLTNHKSKRTTSAVFHASNAEKVVALTGTPIWNLPPDLWSVLGLVAPGGFGDRFSFCMRYGLPVHTGFGVEFTGISHEEELRKRVNEVMLRRRWQDVSDDIPPITRNVVIANIDDKTRRKLDVMAAKIQADRTDRSTTVGNLATYRQQLSLFKVPTVLAEVKKALDASEPIVVWTWHVELARQIADALGDQAYLLHGEVPAVKREQRMDAWKADAAAGVARALVATMPVAQVGIDLSAARLALFAEVDWTPAIIAQAEMRTFTPTRGMNVTFVVADHIIEQRLVRALIAKLGAANPLGVGAAIDAIDALRTALFGTPEEADLSRLLDDLLADVA